MSARSGLHSEIDAAAQPADRVQNVQQQPQRKAVKRTAIQAPGSSSRRGQRKQKAARSNAKNSAEQIPGLSCAPPNGQNAQADAEQLAEQLRLSQRETQSLRTVAGRLKAQLAKAERDLAVSNSSAAASQNTMHAFQAQLSAQAEQLEASQAARSAAEQREASWQRAHQDLLSRLPPLQAYHTTPQLTTASPMLPQVHLLSLACSRAVTS